MTVDRRHLLAATATAGLGLGLAAANTSGARAATTDAAGGTGGYVEFEPSPGRDVTMRLQRTIDRAASLGRPIRFAPGSYDVNGAVAAKYQADRPVRFGDS